MSQEFELAKDHGKHFPPLKKQKIETKDFKDEGKLETEEKINELCTKAMQDLRPNYLRKENCDDDQLNYMTEKKGLNVSFVKHRTLWTLVCTIFYDTEPLQDQGYSYVAIREELKDRMASPREFNKNFWAVVDAAFKCMEDTSDENYIENSFPQIEGDLRNATKLAKKNHWGSARFEKPDSEKRCVKMTVQTLVHLPACDRMLLCVVCDDHKKTFNELKFLEDERNYDAVLFAKGAKFEQIKSLSENWNEAEYSSFNEGFFDEKETTTDFLDECDFKNRKMVLKASSTLPVDLVEAYLSRGGICIVNVAQDAAEYNALIIDFDDIRKAFLERFDANESTLIVSSTDVANTEEASVSDCIDKHLEKYEEAYTDVAVEFRYGFNVKE